jgi:A/G-specific adenine glycosylase
MSEILLHRTRADQALPVYAQFIEEFPSCADIVRNGTRVRGLLKALGLHWRTVLLLEMAREIESRFGGAIPADPESLRSLPGVSDYISEAVRCFAFGFPAVLLDTNITRIVGRLEGLPINDSARRSSRYRLELQRLLPSGGSRNAYLALIDIGAAVCRPTHPSCPQCPFEDLCQYAAGLD